MQEQNKLTEIKEDATKKIKPGLENDSFQYNTQDLDQEQRVDVNPVQSNSQNIHIHVSNTDFSGKIAGTALIEVNKKAAAGVSIYLFFGNESKRPVYKTNTDINGNFVIEDLPPGYYSLFAKLGAILKFEAFSIKVLPCQKVRLFIHLK